MWVVDKCISIIYLPQQTTKRIEANKNLSMVGRFFALNYMLTIILHYLQLPREEEDLM
jgi:hypothetical protein